MLCLDSTTSHSTEVTTSAPECHDNGVCERGVGRVLRWQAADSDWSGQSVPPTPIGMAFGRLQLWAPVVVL
jgi:hypothetical protein